MVGYSEEQQNAIPRMSFSAYMREILPVIKLNLRNLKHGKKCGHLINPTQPPLLLVERGQWAFLRWRSTVLG